MDEQQQLRAAQNFHYPPNFIPPNVPPASGQSAAVNQPHTYARSLPPMSHFPTQNTTQFQQFNNHSQQATPFVGSETPSSIVHPTPTSPKPTQNGHLPQPEQHPPHHFGSEQPLPGAGLVPQSQVQLPNQLNNLTQPTRHPSHPRAFMLQSSQPQPHPPALDPSTSNPPQLTRVPGIDPSTIMEIAQLIRQPNGASKLSPSQISLWNEYRAKCSTPTHPQPRLSSPMGTAASHLQTSQQFQQKPSVPQPAGQSVPPNSQMSAQQQRQKIQQQQQLQIQQMQQHQMHQQQMILMRQQQQQQQQRQQQHQNQDHHLPHHHPNSTSQQQGHQQTPQLGSRPAPAPAPSRSASIVASVPVPHRSVTPSFSPQASAPRPASDQAESPPLIRSHLSPNKQAQLISLPRQGNKPVDGPDHSLVVDHKPAGLSSPPPAFLRAPKLAVSPNFTKCYPDNSSLGPDGRPRARKKLSLSEQTKLVEWIRRDEAYEIRLSSDRNQKRAIAQNTYRQSIIMNRTDWLGEPHGGRSPQRFQIRLPIDNEREQAAGKRKARPRLKFSKPDLEMVANVEEILVPIRLEIEVDHWKLRDTFTWNLKEPLVTPEVFAAHLCEDLILPSQHFYGPIVASIKEQLDEYKLHENFDSYHAIRRSSDDEHLQHEAIRANQELGYLTPEEQWWNRWRENLGRLDEQQAESESVGDENEEPDSKRMKWDPARVEQNELKLKLEDGEAAVSCQRDFFKSEPEDHVLSVSTRDDELRIPVTLDIISGSVHLTDRFEWEISEVNNCPEEFTETYVNDLGLSGEFKTAITHSIREQIETYVKSLALVEHVNGYPVPNDELRYAFLQPITDPIRTTQVDDYTPFLNLLSAEELDRQEKEHDRESRRKRRQTRSRRGVNLPDRESQRTVRSIVPIQGIKMVVPYQDDNEDLIVPIQPIAEPFPIKESSVELPGLPEPQTKRHVPPSKESALPESTLGTPNKSAGHRASRRLRGATADIAPSATPPPSGKVVDSSYLNDRDEAPTPSQAGTPVPSSQTNLKKKPESQTNKQRKLPNGGRTRGINWEALGLHDPMIDGVWHCSNCGCPEHVAVGRRKGLGGKDTLCGECGRYIHRFKKNRPTIYNTSADYHTSLKLEADKAQQAIADQAMARKDKIRHETHAVQQAPSVLNNKKRKKEAPLSTSASGPHSSLLSKRVGLERAGSTTSSVRSGGSRESSPITVSRPKTATKASRRPPRVDESSDPKMSRKSTRHSSGGSETSPEAAGGTETIAPLHKAQPLFDTTLSIQSRQSTHEQVPNGEAGRVGTRPDKPDGERVEDEKPVDSELAELAQNASGSSNDDNGTANEKPKTAPGDSRRGSVVGSNSGKADKRGSSHRSSINSGSSNAKAIKKIERPKWIIDSLDEIRKAYPNDRIAMIPRFRRDVSSVDKSSPDYKPPGSLGTDWRLKCMDCPGKLYTLGPGDSFTNFDVHLKNRQHRQKVEERINASMNETNGQSNNAPPLPPSNLSPTSLPTPPLPSLPSNSTSVSSTPSVPLIAAAAPIPSSIPTTLLLSPSSIPAPSLPRPPTVPLITDPVPISSTIPTPLLPPPSSVPAASVPLSMSSATPASLPPLSSLPPPPPAIATSIPPPTVSNNLGALNSSSAGIPTHPLPAPPTTTGAGLLHTPPTTMVHPLPKKPML